MTMSPTRLSVSPAPLTPLFASTTPSTSDGSVKGAAPMPLPMEWNLPSPAAALQARASRALARRRNQCRPLLAGLRVSSDLAQRALALILCCIMLTVSSRARAAAALPRPQHQSHSQSDSHSARPAATSSSRGRRPAPPHHSSADSSPQRSPPESASSAHAPPLNFPHTAPCSPFPPPSPAAAATGGPAFASSASAGVGTGSLDSSRLPVPVGGSYYETLLLSPSASSSDVKRAYRRLAMRYHPDKVMAGGGQQSSAGGFAPPHRALSAFQCQQLFILVQEAYECLSDPVERRRYDYALRTRTRYKRLARSAALADDEAEPASPSSPAPSAASTAYADSRNSTANSSRRSSYSAGGWGSATSSAQSSRRGSLAGRPSTLLLLPLALFSALVLRPMWAVATALPSPLSLLRRFTAVATLAVYCAVYIPVRAAVLANAARLAVMAALRGRPAMDAAGSGLFSALPLSTPSSAASSPQPPRRRVAVPPAVIAPAATAPAPAAVVGQRSPFGSSSAIRPIPLRSGHCRYPSVASTSSDGSSPSLSESPGPMANGATAAQSQRDSSASPPAPAPASATAGAVHPPHPPSLSDAECDADEWNRSADCCDSDSSFVFGCPSSALQSAVHSSAAPSSSSSSSRLLRPSASMPNFAAPADGQSAPRRSEQHR